MEKIIKSIFKTSVISSLVMIVLGLLLVFESDNTIVAMSYIIGGVLAGIGLLAIFRFISNKNQFFAKELDIVYGVIAIVLGLLVIKNPYVLAKAVQYVIGIFILISGATKLQSALELKNEELNVWKGELVIAIISLACGVLIMFNPMESANAMTMIIGVFILVYAVLDLISSYIIRKNLKEVIKNAPSIETVVVDVESKDVDEKPKTKKTTKRNTKNKKNDNEQKD